MSYLPVLSQQKEQYCREYVKSLSISTARKLSGYKGNVNLMPMKKRIRELFNQVYERLDVVPSRTIAELARIAFFDPLHCYDQNGKMLHIKDMNAATRACIREIEETEHYNPKTGELVRKTSKLKMFGKVDALEMLAKSQGLLQTGNAPQADNPNANSEKVVFNLVMGNGEQLTISKADSPTEIEVEGERVE